MPIPKESVHHSKAHHCSWNIPPLKRERLRQVRKTILGLLSLRVCGNVSSRGAVGNSHKVSLRWTVPDKVLILVLSPSLLLLVRSDRQWRSAVLPCLSRKDQNWQLELLHQRSSQGKWQKGVSQGRLLGHLLLHRLSCRGFLWWKRGWFLQCHHFQDKVKKLPPH